MGGPQLAAAGEQGPGGGGRLEFGRGGGGHFGDGGKAAGVAGRHGRDSRGECGGGGWVFGLEVWGQEGTG